jgi:hypothetical protein
MMMMMMANARLEMVEDLPAGPQCLNAGRPKTEVRRKDGRKERRIHRPHEIDLTADSRSQEAPGQSTIQRREKKLAVLLA